MQSLIILWTLIITIFGQAITSQVPTVAPTVAGTQQFFVTDSNYNKSCFVLEMKGSFTFNYMDGNKIRTTRKDIDDFPHKVWQVNGTCGKKIQEMIITWPTNQTWTLKINTVKFEESKKFFYKLKNLSITILPNAQEFPGLNVSKPIVLTGELVENQVRVNSYFNCIHEFTFLFNKTRATLVTTNLKFQAFRSATKSDSDSIFQGPVTECPLDIVSNNIVPLIVGGVLAVMVIVVLITYIIGRRRHRSSYQTI